MSVYNTMYIIYRYNTLHEDERREFGLEEDNLLSIVLHDLLVFMLMVGMGHEETTMLIHRFAARIRLATSEEKLLQQTLKYIEKNVRRLLLCVCVFVLCDVCLCSEGVCVWSMYTCCEKGVVYEYLYVCVVNVYYM